MNEFVSVSVIIPAINETASLKDNVKTVLETCDRGDLEEFFFVVCDKTTPECLAAIRELMNGGCAVPMRLHKQIRPGIGPAVFESLDRIRAKHAVYLAADSDTDAAVVARLIRAAKANPGATVCASRWLPGGGFAGYGAFNKLLNLLFQKWIQLLFFTRLTDITYGFRLFPVWAMKSVTCTSTDFSFGVETYLKCLRLGYEFIEVPAVWRAREQGDSQNSYLTKLKYIKTVFRARFTPKSRLKNPSFKGTDDWDYVILTASNPQQAQAYEKQIAGRFDAGRMPSKARFAVLPDPGGIRVGSGGAALHALKYIRGDFRGADCFDTSKILLIQSGGDSRRVPQSSSAGKLFSPVPRERAGSVCSTLFDEIMDTMAALPCRLPPGLLHLAGDILLKFDPLEADIPDAEAAALTVKERAETGQNHGVFVPGTDGFAQRFLHKRPAGALQSEGAVDADGKVFIDTGAIWLGSEVVKSLFGLISTEGAIDDAKLSRFVSEKARLSFYADFVYPMAEGSALEQYLKEPPEGGFNPELESCREALWQALRPYRLKLIELKETAFIHFGTTAELLDLMNEGSQKHALWGWKNTVCSEGPAGGAYTRVNSVIDGGSVIGPGSYIENSRLINCVIGARCVIAGIPLNGVTVPGNTVIHCLKRKDGRFIVRIYGVDDDPKAGLETGGTFLGRPLAEFIEENRLHPETLWGDSHRDLWNAKLFLASPSLEESLEHALSLCSGRAVFTCPGPFVSLADIY